MRKTSMFSLLGDVCERRRKVVFAVYQKLEQKKNIWTVSLIQLYFFGVNEGG